MADKSHVKVHGDAANGFIVEVHDGEVFHSVGGMFTSARKATTEALKQFHEKYPDRATPDNPEPADPDEATA